MQKSLFLFVIAVLLLSLTSYSSNVIDTSLFTYNFNSLATGNLNAQDGWTTTKHNTTVDYQVSAAAGYDTSIALTFSQSGPSVGIDGSRTIASLFNSTGFSNTASKYVITFDVYRSYWGVQFAIGADINNDGKITNSDAAEKALVFSTSTQAGDKLTLPNGSVTTYAAAPTLAWTTVEITLSNFSSSTGTVSVRTKVLGTSTWNTLASNLALGIDTVSTTKTNPALWKMLFLHNEGAGGKLDNFTFTRIGPHILTAVHQTSANSEISIYPNPSEGKISIALPFVPFHTYFNLYETNGAVIRKLKIEQANQILNLEGIPAGLYFFTIQDNDALRSSGKIMLH